MKLQEDFVKQVKHSFKEQGEAWLDTLPSLIEYAEKKWSIKMAQPYDLSFNYVAPAVMGKSRDVVVKISISGPDYENELTALHLFQGKDMVKVIDYDREYGIILLERLSPGYTLAEVKNDEEACRIAAHVLGNLFTLAPENSSLPTTTIREEGLRKIWERHQNGIGPISREILTNARKVFSYLNSTTEEAYLLHGDFHPYNVLASGKDQWTVIDPKGLIGEREYDLIQYMLNKLPDQGAFEVIKKRVGIFTKELDLNKERLLLWGYCHSVLSSAWTVEDDTTYDKRFFGGIEIFERLYRENYGCSIKDKLREWDN